MSGTDPLRVLFVVPNLDVGGAERQVTTLLTRLDPRRFRPSLVCLGDEGELFGVLRAAGVPARALHLRRSQAPLILVELVRQMRRERIDLVVTRSYNAEVLGRVAALLAGVRHAVVWVHNPCDLRPRSRLRVTADRVLDHVTTAYYAVTHCQLPYLIDELRYPPEKIHVVYNGVDPGADPAPAPRDGVLARGLGIGPGDVVVGIAAVLRPEKDHLMLVRAFADVAATCPEAVLLVVGDGPMLPAVTSLAERLGLAGRIRFAGLRVDVDRILPLLDVFVLPSRTEAFPMALLEAMAAGLPSVCTAVGGVPEMVDDGVTGYLVPVGDQAALTARLTELVAEPERRARMGAAARRRLEDRFTLDSSIRRSEYLLATTAGRPWAAV